MKVTVIIPTVGRDSLDVAINSVKMQSHEVLEIIIVDDSLTQSILAGECRVLRTGGGRGVSYARNLGALSAKGDLIAFLDDDDVWLRDKIDNQISEIVRKDLDVLISSAFVNEKIRPYRDSLLNVGLNPLKLLYSKPHLLRSKAYLPTASYIIKKKVFETVTFQEDLLERENLRFLVECFGNKMRIGQSLDVLIQVNYNKNNSLSRMSLDAEVSWFNYLHLIDQGYAQNFLIESSRNFARIKDYDSAKEILKLSESNRFLHLVAPVALRLAAKLHRD